MQLITIHSRNNWGYMDIGLTDVTPLQCCWPANCLMDLLQHLVWQSMLQNKLTWRNIANRERYRHKIFSRNFWFQEIFIKYFIQIFCDGKRKFFRCLVAELLSWLNFCVLPRALPPPYPMYTCLGTVVAQILVQKN